MSLISTSSSKTEPRCSWSLHITLFLNFLFYVSSKKLFAQWAVLISSCILVIVYLTPKCITTINIPAFHRRVIKLEEECVCQCFVRRNKHVFSPTTKRQLCHASRSLPIVGVLWENLAQQHSFPSRVWHGCQYLIGYVFVLVVHLFVLLFVYPIH